MPFNQNATYRTVVDAEGQLYVSQGGKYYNRQGDELSAIPRTPQGFSAPTDPNLVAAFTSGTISGVAGSFTTLAASSTVSGTGFSNYLAAPPAIGSTTPGVVKTSNLQATFTDSSATPGNVTNNSPRGRAAFAAAGNSVTVTNSLVAATSSVFVQKETADATLTTILSVVPGAGSFVVTGNAAATATTKFSFLVVN